MNNGIPSKAAAPQAPKISMITLSIRIPSTASNFLINAFKNRGFGGEFRLVSTNMKWCGAFLFGAIVLPIVILNFVVAFVFPKFPNDLDLTSQFRFVCGRVDGTWYGRDTLLGG